MPAVKRRRESFVSITGNKNYYDNDDEFPKSYCPNCEHYNQYNLLKERIYLEHQLINGELPHDHDNYLQCYVCGTVVPIVHAKQDNEIVGIKDIPESIHDSKRLVVTPFIKPRTNKKQKNRERLEPEELDSDIQQRIERGSKLLSYQDNSADL